MDLLKYVEPMKHLPERFSNLAFWRGVRKFKDDVVNALEYIDGWGENLESRYPLSSLNDSMRISYKNLTSIVKDSISLVTMSGVDGVYGVYFSKSQFSINIGSSRFSNFALLEIGGYVDTSTTTRGRLECVIPVLLFPSENGVMMQLSNFSVYLPTTNNTIDLLNVRLVYLS